jgi:hypothetical protein
MLIKVIWDFRGKESREIAKHHAIHLKEFCEKENLPFTDIDFTELSDFYTIAYITIDKIHVNIIRDALKPHRAEVVS